jgi:hypothetical protein
VHPLKKSVIFDNFLNLEEGNKNSAVSKQTS